jgi:single-strand DNA-binding protein
MNSVTLSGNLTEDPKLVNVDERAICEMRLAVDNGRRRKTTYIDIRTFDEQAYICAEFLHKGSKAAVQGRLILDEWRNAAGEKRSNYSVIGRVEFLDPPPVSDGGETAPAEVVAQFPVGSS